MKIFAKILFWLTVAPLLGGVLVSCDEHAPELSQVAVLVTPKSDVVVKLASGEKQLYTLDLSTINDYVATLKIVSFDRYNGETIWVNEKIGAKEKQYKFIYTAPQIQAEQTEVTITFTVTDNLGNEASATRKVSVNNKIVTLAELTGIILYAPFTGGPDALSLSDVTQTFNLADSPTPELADIFIVSDDDSGELSWMSNTNAKFLRNTTFNYAEASAMSISTVYNSSTHTDVVRDIRVNDIIIVGHGTAAQGVFFVTNIINIAGKPNCIQMNYKGVGQTEPIVTDPAAPSDSATDSDS